MTIQLDDKGELEQELNRMAIKGRVDINSQIVRDAIWKGYRILNSSSPYGEAVKVAKQVLVANAALERELPGATAADPIFRQLANKQRTCICGYMADDEDALVDHISYMVAVVGDSNAKHRERR